jgi:hypothetical protein
MGGQQFFFYLFFSFEFENFISKDDIFPNIPSNFILKYFEKKKIPNFQHF